MLQATSRLTCSILRWCLRHPLGRGQWIALGLWMLALAGTMIWLGDHISGTTNLEVEAHDQSAYLHVTEQNRGSWWPTATDGVRNPLFPWILAQVAEGDQATMFAAGRWLNVRLGALVLIALGVWAGWRLPWAAAMLFVTLVGPGVLLPISTYLGAEVLLYGLYFASWMMILGLLERLTFRRFALLGVTLAVAYLTKPSISVMIVALCMAAVSRWLLAWRGITEPAGWSGWRPAAGAALALVLALGMMTPRMLDSWKRFGDPLQNTSSNHLWEVDWATCYPKLWYLNPRRIHKLPEAERPTAERFFRLKGWSGLQERLLRGMSLQVKHIFQPDRKALRFLKAPTEKKPIRKIFPYRGFLLLPPLLLIGCFAGALIHRQRWSVIPPAAGFQVLFIVLLVMGSIVALGWYSPLAPGARFIMSLYAPLLGSLLLGADRLRQLLGSRWADGFLVGIAWWPLCCSPRTSR